MKTKAFLSSVCFLILIFSSSLIPSASTADELTLSGDSDGEFSDSDVVSSTAPQTQNRIPITSNPDFLVTNPHSSLCLSARQQEAYERGERFTSFDLSRLAHARLVSRYWNTSLSLSPDPQNSKEAASHVFHHRKTAPHAGSFCFDNRDIKERFEAILDKSIFEVYSHAAFSSDGSATLFNFFLSYFDEAPRRRCFLLQGGKLIQNNGMIAGMAGNVENWERARKACLVAAQLYHQEAVAIVIKNGELFPESIKDRALREVEQLKLANSCYCMQAVALAHANTTVLIKKEMEQNAKATQKIVPLFEAFDNTYTAFNTKTYGELKLNKQTEKALEYKDAADELLKACRGIKGFSVHAIKHLKACIDNLNKLVGETLEEFNKQRTQLAQLLIELNGGKLSPGSKSMNSFMENFFKSVPGVPTPEQYCNAYTLLLDAAKRENQDSYDKMDSYVLAHRFARKYFGLLADDAPGETLLKVYREFEKASRKFLAGNKDYSDELYEASLYFFKKALHAAELEVSRTTTEQECAALANDYYAKAGEAQQENSLTTEAYLTASAEFRAKQLTLQSNASVKDMLLLCQTYFELAVNTATFEKKEFWFRKALKSAQNLVQFMKSKHDEYSFDLQGMASKRIRAAAFIKIIAGIGYYIFLQSPKKKDIQFQRDLQNHIFDTQGNKPFIDYKGVDANPSAHETAFGQAFRGEAILCAADQCMAMIDLLNTEVPWYCYSFGLRVLSAARSISEKGTTQYEKYIAKQMLYLEKRSDLIKQFSSGHNWNDSAALYHEIAQVTVDQRIRGIAYARALECCLRPLEGDLHVEPSEYINTIDRLIGWIGELTQSADAESTTPPSALSKARVHQSIADLSTRVLRAYHKQVPAQLCNTLYAKLRTVSADKDFGPVPFSLLKARALHLFEAAWLCRNTVQCSVYLTQAVMALESLLYQLPRNVWAAPTHYTFLGNCFQTLAQYSNQAESAQHTRKGRAYLDEAQKIAAAQRKACPIAMTEGGLAEHVDDETSAKDAPNVQDIARTFQERLKLLRSSSGDESSTSTEKAPSLTKEELQNLTCYLAAQEPPADNLSRVSPFVTAARLYENLEAQENLFRNFLRYAIDIPVQERLFERKEISLEVQTSNNVNKAHGAWHQALGSLMPLIILGHTQASAFITLILKNPEAVKSLEESIRQYLELSLELPYAKSAQVIGLLREANYAEAVTLLLDKYVQPTSTSLTRDAFLGQIPARNYDLVSLKEAIGLSRSTAENLGRLAEAPGQKDSDRIQNHMNAGLYYEKTVDLMIVYATLTSLESLPQSQDFQNALGCYKKARTCRGISLKAKKDASVQAANVAGRLVDWRGDAASSEECLVAYKEYMSAIEALEDCPTEDSRETVSPSDSKVLILDAFKNAIRYHTLHMRKSSTPLLAVARKLAQGATSIETGVRNQTKSRRPIYQSCLLYLASLNFKAWLESLESTYTAAQIEEALKCYQTGYQRASVAELPVLQARFLGLLLDATSKSLALFEATCAAQGALLERCEFYHSKIALPGPDTAYNKTIRAWNRALAEQNRQQKIEQCTLVEKCATEFLTVCEQAISKGETTPLVARDGVQEPLFTITIKERETSVKYSWIRAELAKIFLELAKQAPSCTETVSTLNNAIAALKISIPEDLQEHKNDQYVWKELAKALVRSIIDEYNDSGSRSSSFSGSASMPASFYANFPRSPRKTRSSLTFEDSQISPRRAPVSSSSSGQDPDQKSPRRGVIAGDADLRAVTPMRMTLTSTTENPLSPGNNDDDTDDSN